MDLFLQIREALSNLTSAKLRSFLAILGILVGTGSVVAMVSGGQLATREALAQFKELGTDLLSVSVYAERSEEGAAREVKLTLKDAREIPAHVPGISSLAPYSTVYVPITFAGRSINSSIIGATNSLKDVIRIKMKLGRFISDWDGYQAYAVIGDGLYNKLKAQGVKNPIGMQINLGPTIFTIIGVADHWKENSFFNQDINNGIVVSIPMAELMSKYAELNNIVMRLEPEADIDKIQAGIKQYIDRVSPGKQLYFRSAKQLITSMVEQQRTLTLLLGLIGSISLLVGGIGVMNIMLVSVVERKREIGIRKAVGARRRDIQLLFLIESITLTVFGGIMGVILGILTSFIISLFAGWEFTVFILPPTIGFVVSVAIGIFFGFYPAYQASRLDPIATLRSD